MDSRDRREESERAEGLNEAFASAAPELDLELVDPAGAESRAVGIAIIPASAESVVEEAPPSSSMEGSEEALLDVVREWETAPPAETVEVFTRLATDPFLAASEGRIQVVDREALEEGHRSQEYQDFLAKYPFFEPRQVSIQAFQAVFLGGSRAQVSYRLHETFQDGSEWAGNGGGLLVQAADGTWKMALWAKRDM